MSELSRRRLLGGALAVAATAGLVACGSGSDAGGGTTASRGDVEPPEGPWRWTDDVGQEIELDAAPVRIAAYGDAAAALMNFGITPVAVFHFVHPDDDATFEDLDLTGVELVGEAYGEINIEALARTAPDLIVTTTYADDTPELMFGFQDEAQLATVRGLAPVIGVLQAGTALDVIAKNEALAAALGVDVKDGRVAEDRAEFEAASAELTEAAAGGLTVVPLYAEQGSGAWFAKAPDDPALAYYQQLGVQFVEIGGEDYYWHNLSWENADRYQGDVVLNSLRNSLSEDELQQQPVFAATPAAQAGQIHDWKFKAMDYRSQTSYMRELAGWLTTDEKVTP